MRNPLKGNWRITGDGITCSFDSRKLVVANSSDEAGSLRLPIKTDPKDGWYFAQLDGTITERTAGLLYFVDEYNHILGEASIGSTSLFRLDGCKELALFVRVPEHCAFTFSHLDITRSWRTRKDAVTSFFNKTLRSRIAVVVPTYPSVENRYLCAFVHARVKAYRDAGVLVDVICAADYKRYSSYEYEGVRVLRIPIDELGHTLARKAYDAVLLHFFDELHAAMLDNAGLGKTQLFLWSHNPETRYWEWPLFTTPYFTDLPELTDEQKRLFAQRDAIIKEFNEKPNVSWIFISEAQKKRAEELIGISFNRVHVIANLVDEQRFPYTPKDPALRTKVFCIRKFDNIATYAIDLDVAAVLELSKRPIFNEMEFDFFGDGPLFDTLLEPLRHFENVHTHKRFLAHDEIAQQHAIHGIGLFASRFDSQGVSMCEAAMSGLAVVGSDIDAANIFLPNDLGLLCEVENPTAYADAIERLATDPDYFSQCSAACHKKVFSLCRREMTIDKEIALLKNVTA